MISDYHWQMFRGFSISNKPNVNSERHLQTCSRVIDQICSHKCLFKHIQMVCWIGLPYELKKKKKNATATHRVMPLWPKNCRLQEQHLQIASVFYISSDTCNTLFITKTTPPPALTHMLIRHFTDPQNFNEHILIITAFQLYQDDLQYYHMLYPHLCCSRLQRVHLQTCLPFT